MHPSKPQRHGLSWWKPGFHYGEIACFQWCYIWLDQGIDCWEIYADFLYEVVATCGKVHGSVSKSERRYWWLRFETLDPSTFQGFKTHMQTSILHIQTPKLSYWISMSSDTQLKYNSVNEVLFDISSWIDQCGLPKVVYNQRVNREVKQNFESVFSDCLKLAWCSASCYVRKKEKQVPLYSFLCVWGGGHQRPSYESYPIPVKSALLRILHYCWNATMHNHQHTVSM